MNVRKIVSIMSVIYLASEPSLEKLQEMVGGYIGGMILPNNKFMYYNEEGELLGLKLNLEASELVSFSLLVEFKLINIIRLIILIIHA